MGLGFVGTAEMAPRGEKVARSVGVDYLLRNGPKDADPPLGNPAGAAGATHDVTYKKRPFGIARYAPGASGNGAVVREVTQQSRYPGDPQGQAFVAGVQPNWVVRCRPEVSPAVTSTPKMMVLDPVAALSLNMKEAGVSANNFEGAGSKEYGGVGGGGTFKFGGAETIDMPVTITYQAVRSTVLDLELMLERERREALERLLGSGRGLETVPRVQRFIQAHHSPWAAEGPPGLGGGFDLFDQRIFGRFVRRQIEAGRCFSLMENLTYGSSLDGAKFTVRVLHPEVVAHGAAFFWLRWSRLRGLERPPIAHANFGRHKVYFLRDRNVWFEPFSARLLEPPSTDEYFPAAVLPEEFRSNATGGFVRYRHRAEDCAGWGVEGVGCQFLVLASGLELAAALQRRLVLPEDWDCRLLPMWE
ncbi:unnamed protein product, partial [Effrenium voratum]